MDDLVEKIEIDVKDAQRNVKSLTKSISNMHAMFDKISAVKFNASSIVNQAKKLQEAFNLPKANTSFKGLTDALRGMADPVSYVSQRLTYLQKQLQQYEKTILKTGFLKPEQAQGLANILAETKALKSNAYLKELAADKEAILVNEEGRLEVATKSLRRALNEQSESTKKSASAWSKLIGRIRNISIYRAIRSGMRWLTQGVSEGLKGLAGYSDDVDRTLSSINNSLGQVRNTLAISFASILQGLEPLIVSISDTLIEALNAFNRALAKAQGQDFFYRAKKSSDLLAESLKKVRKFSFDAFNVLSGGDNKTDTKDLFDKVYFSEAAKEAAGDTDALVESANDANNSFNDIADTLVGIGVTIYKIVDALGGLKTVLIALASYLALKGTISAVSKLNSLFSKTSTIFKDLKAAFELGFGKTARMTLSEYFETAKGGLSKMKIATTALTSAVAGFAAFKIADTIFGQFEKEGKVIAGIVGIVASAFMGLAAAALAAAGTLSWGVAIPGIVAAIGVGIASLKAMHEGNREIQGLYNGGFTTANFIATNENGRREWIGKNAGATAVVNDTQMSDIMYSAVKDGCYEGVLQAAYQSRRSGNANNNASPAGTYSGNIVDWLGTQIARSSAFRNEMNRTNPALNLR